MKRRLYLIVAFGLATIIYNPCRSQDCNSAIKYIPIPGMFVYKKDGNPRKEEFWKNRIFHNSKFKKLKKLNGSTDSVYFYNYNPIKEIIEKYQSSTNYVGLRFYFARYDNTNAPSGFPKLNHKLILLISPQFEPQVTNEYYFINDNSNSYNPVPETIADSWKNGYEKYDKNCQKIRF